MSNANTNARAVPPLTLERWALGELSAAEAAAVEAALGGPAAAAAVRQEMDAEARALFVSAPPAAFAATVAARVSPPRKALRLPVWSAGLASAAAALAVFAWAAPETPAAPGDAHPSRVTTAHADAREAGVRTKGSATAAPAAKPLVMAYVRTDAGSRPVVDGEQLPAGAVLQLAYDAAGAPHGMLVSVDGRGQLTLHHPPSPRGTTALLQDGETRLSHAYELDDAPEYERFVLLTLDAPIPVDNVMAAMQARVERDAPTVVPDGYEAVVLTVKKPVALETR